MIPRGLYAVGKIVKLFGLKGEVVVEPMSDDLQRFEKLDEVFVGMTEEDAVAACVIAARVQQRGVRLRFKGVADRTTAAPLVGRWLFVDEKRLRKLPRGTYFVHTIIGLTVVDQQGRVVGVVKEVWKLPANDVYVVERDGRELMVPAVKEFVTAIDPASGTMTVRLIEGMEPE